jgi:hypothetical protein
MNEGEEVKEVSYATSLYLRRVSVYEVQKKYNFRYHCSLWSLSLLKGKQF